MNIVIDNIKLKYDQHNSLVQAHIRPGWFFRLIGAKNVPVMFIGHGTRWESYPERKTLHKRIVAELTAAEKNWAHVLRMNPKANLAELAKTINKQVNQ